MRDTIPFVVYHRGALRSISFLVPATNHGVTADINNTTMDRGWWGSDLPDPMVSHVEVPFLISFSNVVLSKCEESPSVRGRLTSRG